MVSTRSFSPLLSAFAKIAPDDMNGAIANNRKKLAASEPKLVASLILLMDSPSLKVQCQAALALRNLASDGMFFFHHRDIRY